MDKNIF